MSLEANTNTTDHRHPDLVAVGLGLVRAAEHASAACPLSVAELSRCAVDSLYTHEKGEHRAIILRALSDASGVPTGMLARAYDAPKPTDAPKNAKGLLDYLNDEVDPEAIVAGIVRFETCHHIRLIYTFANRFAAKAERTAEELFFYGFIGLMNALRSYTPTTGTISTFAAFRINGSIRDGIRSESPVPKRLTTFARAVESAEEKLTHALSRIPSKAEVAAMLGSQSKYMHLYPRLAHQASLEEMEGRYTPATEDDAYTQTVDNETRALVSDALNSLTPEEASAVRLHIMEAVSLRDSARELQVTQKQFTALVEGALAKLRAEPAMQAWSEVAA